MKPDMEGPRLPRLEALTSIRFAAAAIIVIHHTPGFFALSWPLWGRVQWDAGVTFFFVLSGFIMMYTYAGSLQAIGARAFWVRRIARIWPAHVIALLLILILLPQAQWTTSESPTAVSFVANLFLLQAWIPMWDY